MRSIPHKGVASLVAAALVLTLPVPALQIAAAQAVRSVVVNLRDVEIEQVAEQISRITGRTLILDPAVTGKVTVVSSGSVTPAGAWELFRSVLRVRGYAAIRSGNAYRIVPQVQAVQGGTIVDQRGTARTQDVVTRVVRLQNLPSAEAARILRPLVASFGSIEASTRPNAVIVTDYADNVRRIETLARTLDGGGAAGASTFQRIPLKFAGAAEVGQAITRILGDEASGGPRVAVDERSNVVLVRGSAGALAEARRVAASLDTPANVALSTRVFRLRHSDAESIAEILRGLLGGQGQATNPIARTLAERTVGAGQTGPGSGSGQQLGALAQLGGQNGANVLGSVLGANAAAQAGDRASPAATGFTTPDIAIQAAPDLNAIVARGSPTAITALAALIDELDIRRPQVRIEAAIVEITGDAAEQFGIQLGFGQGALPTGAGTSFSNAGVSLTQVLGLLGVPAAALLPREGGVLNIGSQGDFGLFIQALSQSTKANLLSTPSVTVLDNEPGEIVVGQNVPFRTGSFSTSGNTTDPFTTIERQDVGITLRVIPRINEGDVVKLEVSQEVSSLVNANVVGAADLITNRRSIKTTVLADNGRTIVLGGLITDDRLSGRSKVPVLGDVPIVGELFKSRRESRTKRTLFLFLRPTILRTQAAVTAQTDSEYSRLRADELSLEERRNLLLDPPGARLPVEIDGVY